MTYKLKLYREYGKASKGIPYILETYWVPKYRKVKLNKRYWVYPGDFDEAWEIAGELIRGTRYE